MLAQNGTIRGTVIEDETGLTVIGANVVIANPLVGASTDLDGQFSISIAPGTYDLKISYISFQTVTVKGVEVKEGEVTLIGSVRLISDALKLEEVVVTATATRQSEAALNTMKKKSATMLDGISAQKMALTGDGTAIEAAKRVTGVSIEGGKYIYVRGLGDRYSKVTLNNMDIPGLDPDRNSLQMDIFPTNLIDNIVVSKNFTAELPADFTGGLVNIETKAFPDERIMNASVGISFNPSMHFNEDYITYEGGNSDWLGFDDGTRELPNGARAAVLPLPFLNSSQEVQAMTESFNPNLATQRETSFLDYSASFSFGDQLILNKKKEGGNKPKLGYIFSLSYKNAQEYYENVTYGEFQRNIDPSIDELNYADLQSGQQGSRSNLVGLLGGLALKTQKTKVRLTAMHLQSGESRAGQFQLDQNRGAVGRSGYIGISDNIEYSERGLTNILLNATHVLDDKGWEFDVRISPTFSTANDPDVRKTAFTFARDTSFQAGNAGFPQRIWRELSEVNLVSKADAIKSYKLFDEDAKFKIGLSHVYKDRDYEILEFTTNFVDGGQSWPAVDPDLVLDPRYIFPSLDNGVYYQSANNVPNPNEYQANAHTIAAYVSNEFSINANLKSIVGLRMENFVQRHTGRDLAGANGNGGNVLEDDIVLESTDFFPTINLIYSLAEEQNLRLGYAKTIARPSFKELSFAQIVDPFTQRAFNGGLFPFTNSGWFGDLTETRIDNIDVRWEMFMEGGQIFSVSGFYKQFDNPIELVRIPLSNTAFEYQPRNVGTGRVFGIEVEATKSLDFLGEKFQKFSLSGNVTFVESFIDMAESEFRARVRNARIGENVDDTRDMAGQAPYVINMGVTYSNPDKGIQSGLFYNVKGPTLLIVGTGFVPDIYQMPFHSLNWGINKTIGEDRNTTLDFKINNMFFDIQESVFQSHNAGDQVFTRLRPGMSISIGVSHNF